MFCYQCEQTAKGSGCTVRGVCGKDPETAVLQDLLVYVAKGLSMYAHRARELGVRDREIDVFTISRRGRHVKAETVYRSRQLDGFCPIGTGVCHERRFQSAKDQRSRLLGGSN